MKSVFKVFLKAEKKNEDFQFRIFDFLLIRQYKYPLKMSPEFINLLINLDVWSKNYFNYTVDFFSLYFLGAWQQIR